MKAWVIASKVGIYVKKDPEPILKLKGVNYTSLRKDAMTFATEEEAESFAKKWNVCSFAHPARL